MKNLRNHIYKDLAVFHSLKHSLSRSTGFTLIETLTAMMLLAISMVIILQLFSGGLKSSKVADDYTRAIFHARSKMEEILLMKDIEEGFQEGEFKDGYNWRVDILPVESESEEVGEEQAGEKPPSPLDMLNVEVKVSWPSGDKEKSFELITLKIAEKGDELNPEPVN